MPFSIMVVDNRTKFRRLLRDNLLDCGFKNVYLSRSGQEAIKKQRNGRYNVILLDMHMPNIDGPETLRRIRAFDKKVLVIVITGFDFKLYKPRTKSLGITSWYSKSMKEMDNLFSEIEEIRNDYIAKKEIANQLSTNELNQLVFQTARILHDSPIIAELFYKVFVKEVPEIASFVKDLEAIKIDKMAEDYRQGIQQLTDSLNDLI